MGYQLVLLKVISSFYKVCHVYCLIYTCYPLDPPVTNHIHGRVVSRVLEPEKI
jgi:hypothetical protein